MNDIEILARVLDYKPEGKKVVRRPKLLWLVSERILKILVLNIDESQKDSDDLRRILREAEV